MAYNFSRTDAIAGSALMDFIKSSTEYQLAKIEKRVIDLTPQRIKYFDSLFSPRLKS